MSALTNLRYILDHPLNRGRPVSTLARVARWQLLGRAGGEQTLDWVEGTRLLVAPGMTGATGNIYCGLHEFAEMGFVLHALRAGDLFLDVGANIGSYTVLAAGACGARVIAFEPDAATAARLSANVAANGIGDAVELVQAVVSDRVGELAFSVGLDTINHVVTDATESARLLPATTLDAATAGQTPFAMKIDIEGYEETALMGAAATLAGPGLRAILIETVTPGARGMIEGAGFRERFYDPRTRTLSDRPVADVHRFNSLFVRDEDLLAERLRGAPARAINGHRV
jgi:FkbM family methyltransferase